MNGRRLLLDTNAIIALLQGKQQLLELTDEAIWIGISIISQLEFLCFPYLNASDYALFEKFVSKVEVIGIASTDHELVGRVIEIRQTGSIKLPDAIIAACAIIRSASLVTADRRLTAIEGLAVISFVP